MIRFRDVSVIYDKTNHTALNNINLDISEGEFVFVVGQSGAGKSTFIKLLLKELDASSGAIYIDRQNVGKIKNRKLPHLRRKLGVVFQNFRLLPDKTVYENIAFAMEIVGRKKSEIKRTVPEALELVGLSHRASYYPDQLSGGEQQRVGIARAIINGPKIIICDEPTGNLDPKTSQSIMDILQGIHSTGTTIIMSTHDKEIVNAMSKRVIALKDGEIMSDAVGGYPDEN